MRDLRARRLIGRDAELAAAAAVVCEGAGAVVVRGEAGAGKSRFIRELTDRHVPSSARVMLGRFSEETSSTAYGPLHEIALSAVVAGVDLARLGPLASPAEVLTGLREPGPVGRLSPIVAAEVVVGLARATSGAPVVAVIEDAHWADRDTSASVAHLARRSRGERIVVLVTARSGPGEPAAPFLDDLRADAHTVEIMLRRLDGDAVVAVLADCLGEPPPDALASFVVDRSDGLPLLVEELVAGAVAAGVLRRVRGRWVADGALGDLMPMTFASSIQRRLERLSEDGRLTVEVASLLGRDFDWADVAAIAQLDPARVRSALRELTGGGLVATSADGRIAFRHALGRDAVFRQLLPSDREELARAGLAVVDGSADPLLAGTLAELAGECAAASEHLVTAARRAIDAGALAGAEATLWRAFELHPTDTAADALLQSLTLQGRADEALRVGRALGSRSSRPVIALQLARAAVAAGDRAAAAAHLDAIRDTRRASLAIGAEVVAAELALARGEFETAHDHAAQAHDRAHRARDFASMCEAFELIGRAARPFDILAAEDAFKRAHDTAVEHHLEPWRLRALHELGTIDLFSTLRTDRLGEARKSAMGIGAMSTLALIDLHLAASHLGRFELDAALASADECVATSQRFQLPTLGMGSVMRGTALAMMGRRADAEEAARDAVACAPDDLDVRAGVVGRVHAVADLVRADFPGALAQLDAAMTVARGSAAVAFPVRGLWALLSETVQGDDAGRAAIDEVAAGPGLSSPLNRGLLGCARAVQERDEDGVDRALSDPATGVWFVAVARLLAADHAQRAGWGKPVRWAQEALAVFADARGQDQLASATRGVLRRAGAVVPRRGRGDAHVPAALRARGVTSREMDVLLLVRDGLTNREIGGRLHLSDRTVEKHVASLLAKTASRRRIELARLSG
ncbi:MAG: AAA family ATPase [Actinobacteria bacterium]|nr:AAA family ATPase [Actinomycetota bacterium]